MLGCSIMCNKEQGRLIIGCSRKQSWLHSSRKEGVFADNKG